MFLITVQVWTFPAGMEAEKEERNKTPVFVEHLMSTRHSIKSAEYIFPAVLLSALLVEDFV